MRLLLDTHSALWMFADQALEIVTRYYPPERIPPRTQYLLTDIFEDLRRRQ